VDEPAFPVDAAGLAAGEGVSEGLRLARLAERVVAQARLDEVEQPLRPPPAAGLAPETKVGEGG
jgi:hypothetical protein